MSVGRRGVPTDTLRLALDTNVLLAGLVSKSSPSRKVVDCLQARKGIPLLSPPVLPEYRAVLLFGAVERAESPLAPDAHPK